MGIPLKGVVVEKQSEDVINLVSNSYNLNSA